MMLPKNLNNHYSYLQDNDHPNHPCSQKISSKQDMRNQFFTQPICFCYVVSSEERKAGKLFLRFPNTYHHVHSPEGAHQKQGHGPSPGILQMHLVKPYCSRAMLCLFKYICRLLRFQPPTILFFHEILIPDTAAKKNCVVL